MAYICGRWRHGRLRRKSEFSALKRLANDCWGFERGLSTKSFGGNEFITKKLHVLSAELLKSPIFVKITKMTFVIKKPSISRILIKILDGLRMKTVQFMFEPFFGHIGEENIVFYEVFHAAIHPHICAN